MYGWFFLIMAFTCNGIANIFLKIGAQNGLILNGNIFQLIQGNKFLLGGAILFGINLIFYILAMKYVPISTAYPIMIGMSLTIITMIGFLFLHETITLMHIISYIFIFTGIFLLAYITK